MPIWYRRLFFSVVYFCCQSQQASAVEYKVSGLFEFDYSYQETSQTNSSEDISDVNSFLRADYGKFRFNQGSNLSLSQAALSFTADWENDFSFHLTGIGYLDDVKNRVGITESYVKYKGTPNQNGIRFQARAGIIYPKISLENISVAWSSPYSLNYSMINSWIAEEVRHIGIESSINLLGKFRNSKSDFSASLSLIKSNDPSGALLSWQGWKLHSRQTLWNETIPLANPAIRLPGAMLQDQADYSDPFMEIDGNFGFHINIEWKWKNKHKILVGRYDNRSKPYLIENGQYGWHTRFTHVGIKWQFEQNITLLSQFLIGDTLMQSPDKVDVVNNDFDSAFLLLSKKIKQHRITARLEYFNIKDNDSTALDDNTESGTSLTFAYVYRLSKHWFLHSEYARIDSNRPARAYHQQPIELVEQQLQLAARYIF